MLIAAQKCKKALDRTFASGIITDRGVGDLGSHIHVIDVQVCRRALHARVLWEPMALQESDVGRLERALVRRRGIIKAHVNSYMKQQFAMNVAFVRSHSPHAEQERLAAEAFERVRADLAAAHAQRHGVEAVEHDSASSSSSSSTAGGERAPTTDPDRLDLSLIHI